MREKNSQPHHERFAVVAFADERVHNIVEDLRREIPPRIAVMPAHVTVKGSFVEPISSKEVQRRIERQALRTDRMVVDVERVALGDTHLSLSLIPNPALVEFHNGLYYALEDLVRDDYGDGPGDEYRPHLTVLYGLSAEERVRTFGLLGPLEQVKDVELREVSLVGRRGGAVDGIWEVIHAWPLGSGGGGERDTPGA